MKDYVALRAGMTYAYEEDGVARTGGPVEDPTTDGVYCGAWWDVYSVQTATLALIPLSIAAFNGVGKFALDRLSRHEGHWQIGDEMYEAAMKMSLLTVVNTGFVLLAVDWRRSTAGPLFDADWYKTSGSSVCLTLILSIGINNAVNLGFAWLFVPLRWFDRGFRCKADSDKHTR